MLKSISVHLYYNFFTPSGTSDKININMTALLWLFVNFYNEAKKEVLAFA